MDAEVRCACLQATFCTSGMAAFKRTRWKPATWFLRLAIVRSFLLILCLSSAASQVTDESQVTDADSEDTLRTARHWASSGSGPKEVVLDGTLGSAWNELIVRYPARNETRHAAVLNHSRTASTAEWAVNLDCRENLLEPPAELREGHRIRWLYNGRVLVPDNQTVLVVPRPLRSGVSRVVIRGDVAGIATSIGEERGGNYTCQALHVATGQLIESSTTQLRFFIPDEIPTAGSPLRNVLRDIAIDVHDSPMLELHQSRRRSYRPLRAPRMENVSNTSVLVTWDVSQDTSLPIIALTIEWSAAGVQRANDTDDPNFGREDVLLDFVGGHSTGSLLIANLTPGTQYEAQYTYRRQNGEVTSVQSEYFITEKRPEVICGVTDGRIIVKQLTTVSIMCNVSGHPQASNLVDAPFSRTLYIDRELASVLTLNLTFVNVTQDMAGEKCIQAHNRLGKTSLCFKLLIKNTVCNPLHFLPGVLPGAKKSSKSSLHSRPGARFYYECKDGYVLVGNSYRTCLPNAQWTGSAASCERPSRVALQMIYADGDTLRLIAHQRHEKINCHAHGPPPPTQLAWTVSYAQGAHNNWRIARKWNNTHGVPCNPRENCPLRPKSGLLSNDIVTCRAQNVVPLGNGRSITAEASISVHVKVVGRYGIVDDTRTIPVGQTTEVPCARVEKYKDIKYPVFWVRVSTEVMSSWRETHSPEVIEAFLQNALRLGEWLQVLNASDSDSGHYVCFAEHSRNHHILMQTLKLHVQELRMLETETTATTHVAQYGGRLRLRCRALGAATITWLLRKDNVSVPVASAPFYDQRIIVDNRTVSSEDGQHIISELVIPLLQAGLTGEYICNATNDHRSLILRHSVTAFSSGKCIASNESVLPARCAQLTGNRMVFVHDNAKIRDNVFRKALALLTSSAEFSVSPDCRYDRDNAERFLCMAAYPGCVVTEKAHAAESWPLPGCKSDCDALQNGHCAREWASLAAELGGGSGGTVCEAYQSLLAEMKVDEHLCVSTRQQATAKESSPQDQCYCHTGQLYEGKKSQAVNGLACEPWSDNNTFHLSRPLEQNYCRNPGGTGRRPWCYTKDPESIVSECGIRQCRNDIALVCQSVDWLKHNIPMCATLDIYAGRRVQVSMATSLGQLNETLHMVLRRGGSLSPTCSEHLKQLLCLTYAKVCSRPAAGHCGGVHVPCVSYYQAFRSECGDLLHLAAQGGSPTAVQRILGDFQSRFAAREEPASDYPECIQLPMTPLNATTEAGAPGCLHPNDTVGVTYRGKVSTTVSGYACQPWNSSFPNVLPPHLLTGKVPHLDGNMCRNPFGSRPHPWCYSTNPNLRWEICYIDLDVCAVELDSSAQDQGPSAGTVLAICIGVFSVLLIGIFIIGYVLHLRRMRVKAHMRDMKMMSETHPITTTGLARRPSISDTQHRYPMSMDNSKIRINPLYPVTSPDLYGITPLQHSQLEFEAKIAEGNFGTVWRAVAANVDGEETTTVAVKTLKGSCTKQMEDGFVKEAQIISRFKHINIIRLLGVCLPSEHYHNPLCLVFEYMEYGDLLHFLKEAQKRRAPTVDIKGRPLPKTLVELYRREQEGASPRPASETSSLSTLNLTSTDLCKLAAQIAYGMHFLSSRGYVHRDLAARNCLVGRNNIVKIADFGLSREVHNRDYYKPMSTWGTLPVRWMPPEVIKFGKHSTESDAWSFGVVLWEIFTLGGIPYFEWSNEEVVRRVCEHGRRLPQPHECPTDIYEMMCECWRDQALDRPMFRRLWKQLTAWKPPRASLSAAGLDDSGSERSDRSLDSDEELEEEDHDAEEEEEVFEGCDNNFLFVTSPHGNIVPVQEASIMAVSTSGCEVTPAMLDRRALKSDSGVHVGGGGACGASMEDSPMSDNFTDESLSESTLADGKQAHHGDPKRPRAGDYNSCKSTMSPSSTWEGAAQSPGHVKVATTCLGKRSEGDGSESVDPPCEYHLPGTKTTESPMHGGHGGVAPRTLPATRDLQL